MSAEIDTKEQKYCDVCDRYMPLSRWTIDEFRCDECVWDALETETLDIEVITDEY